MERLLKLHLIKEVRNDKGLTISGKEHFDSPPQSVFAAKPRQRNGW
jgi:hypothetical protein